LSRSFFGKCGDYEREEDDGERGRQSSSNNVEGGGKESVRDAGRGKKKGHSSIKGGWKSSVNLLVEEERNDQARGKEENCSCKKEVKAFFRRRGR